MANKYRLSASIYDREKEDDKVNPYKIYFISVEGNHTEREYFEGLSVFRDKLGINALVDVEVLKRTAKDTNSAPQQVLELLEEYIELRGLKGYMIDDIPKELIEEFGYEHIAAYLENPDSLSAKQKKDMQARFLLAEYDLNYRRYLSKYNGDTDEFCIMIDRDRLSHSEKEIRACIEHCRDKNYRCFIANPCFEFWLLLHLSDVKTEYAGHLNEILENRKVSNRHTYVSHEVANKAHHGKSNIHFEAKYLPHIKDAVERAKKFASDEYDLIDAIGCNLWKMIEEMESY